MKTSALTLASDTEAYAGHLTEARELTARAVQSAIQADSKENGAIWQADCRSAGSRLRSTPRKRGKQRPQR